MSKFDAEIVSMIQDCDHRSEHLNSWEQRFLESLSDRINVGIPLSEKQYMKLEQIWERVSNKGIYLR